MGTNRYLTPTGVMMLGLILGVISCDNDVRITKVYTDPTRVPQYVLLTM